MSSEVYNCLDNKGSYRVKMKMSYWRKLITLVNVY